VKETKSRWGKRNNKVNNTIQNGVKNHQYTNKR
jgi:hypothetical protein